MNGLLKLLVNSYLNVGHNALVSDVHFIGTDQFTVHVLSSLPFATRRCNRYNNISPKRHFPNGTINNRIGSYKYQC